MTKGVRCQGVKADGEPCEAWSVPPSLYCRHHQEQEDTEPQVVESQPYEPPAVPTAMESDRFGNLFVALSNGRVFKTNPRERNPEWKLLPTVPMTKEAGA